MNNDELKKKIVEILGKEFTICEKTDCDVCVYLTEYPTCRHLMYADALIAAGIGDVSELKKHRILVKPVSILNDENFYIVPQTEIDIKQLYNGEEVEQIVKERDQYKHRAEVAEAHVKTYEKIIEKAEKEFWRGRKDD